MGRGLRVAAGVGVALLGVGAAIVAALTWDRRHTVAASAAPVAMTTTLDVEPFRIREPAPIAWQSPAFAESLAARLARMPGLTVRVAGGSFGFHSEFTVRGDVASRDGRLVIAARLYRDTDRDAVWTATFWRGDSLTSDLVSDLAAGIAEAIYGQLARRTGTSTGERP